MITQITTALACNMCLCEVGVRDWGVSKYNKKEQERINLHTNTLHYRPPVVNTAANRKWQLQQNDPHLPDRNYLKHETDRLSSTHRWSCWGYPPTACAAVRGKSLMKGLTGGVSRTRLYFSSCQRCHTRAQTSPKDIDFSYYDAHQEGQTWPAQMLLTSPLPKSKLPVCAC